MTFWIITKFHQILLSSFRGQLTNCFSSIFHFGKISRYKRGMTPRKNNESEFRPNIQICTSTHHVLQNYKVSLNSVKQFKRSCTVKLFQYYISFWQNFQVQNRYNSQEKNWIRILCIYAHLHIMYFITTKFHQILLSGFKGVSMTNKTEPSDWLTDDLTDWGRVKNIKTCATHCVGYNYQK